MLKASAEGSWHDRFYFIIDHRTRYWVIAMLMGCIIGHILITSMGIMLLSPKVSKSLSYPAVIRQLGKEERASDDGLDAIASFYKMQWRQEIKVQQQYHSVVGWLLQLKQSPRQARRQRLWLPYLDQPLSQWHSAIIQGQSYLLEPLIKIYSQAHRCNELDAIPEIQRTREGTFYNNQRFEVCILPSNLW